MKKDWDTVYKTQGMVQKKPSSFLIRNLDQLKQRKVKKVLDVACGTGRNAILLAKEGFGVIGIDPSKTALQMLEKNAEEQEVSDKIDVKEGVQEDLPFEDESFDAVVAISTFHHNKLEGAEKTIGEFYRVLKKSGLLVMNCISTKDRRFGRGQEIEPNTFIKFGEIDDYLPHHFFSEDEITKLVGRFKVIELKENTETAKAPFTPGTRGFWEVVAEKAFTESMCGKLSGGKKRTTKSILKGLRDKQDRIQ